MITPRERNPERSRARILESAFEEFAEKGFAGARVESIARRAGLNKQLISHHFGGKEALYRAVLDDWLARPLGELNAPGDSGLATMFDRAAEDTKWARLMLWEALEGLDPAGADRRRERYGERVDGIRRAQEAGVLPADLDPELLLLTFFGAAVYPLLLPQVAELVTGLAPTSKTFRKRYKDHLNKVLTVLSGGRSA
jgi:TetR/AcrR family transcriptional regulator